MAVGHKVSTGFLLFLWFRCASKAMGQLILEMFCLIVWGKNRC